MLDDTDHEEQFMRDAAVLRRMRRDFELFNSQMFLLSNKDMQLMKSHLTGEKDFYELAEECDITYDSAKQKIKRIKRVLKQNVIQFASMSYYG